jgi:hypothetical protein
MEVSSRVLRYLPIFLSIRISFFCVCVCVFAYLKQKLVFQIFEIQFFLNLISSNSLYEEFYLVMEII